MPESRELDRDLAATFALVFFVLDCAYMSSCFNQISQENRLQILTDDKTLGLYTLSPKTLNPV